MPNPKCAVCGKTAYPLESVTAIEKSFHKFCFKCSVCNTTLNLKNFKGLDGKIYCFTHTPKPKNTAIGTDAVTLKSAVSAPKKSSEVRGIHKADPRVAPARSGDFSVNKVGDQSTESAPETSGITYDQNTGDQSTENTPESSSIAYDANNADQSTESNPESSGISYDQNTGDQSTESNPESSNISYDQSNADQSTESNPEQYQ
jgi:hypothetical protein